MTHILTINVVDWYQRMAERFGRSALMRRDALERQLDRVLGLLAEHDTRATFFCDMRSLERSPKLVRRMAKAGHEVGVYADAAPKRRASRRSATGKGLRTCVAWLSDLVGRAPLGVRSAAGSLTWPLRDEHIDLLQSVGLRYEAGVMPFFGWPWRATPDPVTPQLSPGRAGWHLHIVPLTVVTWCGIRWPVSGGVMWRVLPQWALDRVTLQTTATGTAFVAALDVWEFDRRPLMAREAVAWSLRALIRGWSVNLQRRSVYRKLDALLLLHRFQTVEDHLKEAERNCT